MKRSPSFVPHSCSSLTALIELSKLHTMYNVFRKKKFPQGVVLVKFVA